MTGEQLYQTACAACHGSDGKGQPRSVVGFDTPLPDFTDCAFSTPEADLDWWSVVHEGGRVRALDRRMPAFGDALSEPEIETVVGYLREFCTEPGWPRGELNFPRPFFTEKAFPENEAVFTIAMARSPEASVEPQFLYEHRLGRRAPVRDQRPARRFTRTLPVRGAAGWATSTSRSNTRSMTASRRGVIVSVGGEVTLPTGKESAGLGGGVTIFEGSGMFGKALPGGSFLQFHAAFEVPSDAEVGGQEGLLADRDREDVDRAPLGARVVAHGRSARGQGGRAPRPNGTSCPRCRSASAGSNTCW